VSFVSVDFATDADTLADDAVDYLRAAMPGWEPADGNLEVWILQAVARQVAELTAVAADVPAAIFRQFGTQLVGLAPQAGARATLTSFWTARDNLGYTIPAGTQVAYRVTGDDLIVFEVVGDTVITPGATTLSGVALQATDVGTAWNAVPTGPLELVDALSWVESVTASTVSAGAWTPRPTTPTWIVSRTTCGSSPPARSSPTTSPPWPGTSPASTARWRSTGTTPARTRCRPSPRAGRG
jgi:hypothetical protein